MAAKSVNKRVDRSLTCRDAVDVAQLEILHFFFSAALKASAGVSSQVATDGVVA